MQSSKRNGRSLKFKLDLDVVDLNDGDEAVDEITVESAKTATDQKLYSDKLKSALAKKFHINSLLETVPFATAEDIRRMRFPIMQIMGIDIHIYVIRLPFQGVYILYNGFSYHLRTRSVCTKVYVSPYCDANQPLKSRDSKGNYKQHLKLIKNCDGDITRWYVTFIFNAYILAFVLALMQLLKTKFGLFIWQLPIFLG